MKLKSQRIYNIVLIFVGIAGWAVTVFLLGESEQINFVSGFFAGIAMIGILRTVKTARIMKNPEKAQDYEAMQKDERTVFVAGKARSMAFYVSILAQCIGAFIAYAVFKNHLICQALCFVTCFQCIVYYVFWIIYNKKY